MRTNKKTSNRLTLIGFDLEALRDALALSVKLCLPKYLYDIQIFNYDFKEVILNDIFHEYKQNVINWNQIRLTDEANVGVVHDSLAKVIKGKEKILNKKRKKSLSIAQLQGKKVSFKVRKSLLDDVYWVIWLHVIDFYCQSKNETDIRKIIDRFPLKVCVSLIKSCYCQEPKQAIDTKLVEEKYFRNLNAIQKKEFLSYYYKDSLSPYYRLLKSIDILRKTSEVFHVQELVFFGKHKMIKYENK